jgi:hypothetical protein
MKTGPVDASHSRRRRSSSGKRSAPDIGWWLLPAFAALFALELVVAFSAFRFWRIEADAIADLKKLVTANELLSSAENDSFELGKLSFQATMSPESRNIEKYRDRLHVKSAAALDDSVSLQLIRNPIREAIRELGKIRSEIARLGDAESQQLESASHEFDTLLRIDERALAALEGRFEDENGGFTVVNSPDPAAARDLLRDQSYQARRNDLGEALLAIQAAFDVRSLSLLTEVSRNSIVFFPLALACLALLLVTTPVLGWFLHTHLSQSIAIHKAQIRKMNEDLSRLMGQLSKTTNERDELARRLSPPPPPAPEPALNGLSATLQASQRPATGLNELPASTSTFPGGLAEDYLTRLP